MAKLFQNIFRTETTRVKWHDYNCGIYFVTICAKNHAHYFGEIPNNSEPLIEYSPIGEHTIKCWNDIPTHFPNVDLGPFVVMPNHIHGIVIINNTTDASNSKSSNLASVIRGFKIGVTKYAKNNEIPFIWQSRYYDHIIRNQQELNNIATYIDNNIAKWHIDCYFDEMG